MKTSLCSWLFLAMLMIQSQADAKQPNIVVFLVDDMGVMDTSVPFLTDRSGLPKRYPLNEYYHTPSMERLAAQGTRLNQFYAMSVCSPTRISILTGQNAARHRTTNWINPKQDNGGKFGPPAWNWAGLNKQDVTLPGLLTSLGYATIHIGKGHFGPEQHEGAEPLNLGFQTNVAGAAFGAPGSYYGQQNYGHGTQRASHAVPHLDAYHGTETFLTEALTIEAKKRVDNAVHKEQPFFLYFAHYAVHAPFDSDPRFAEAYRNSGKPANAQAFATLIEGMDKSLGDMLDHFDDLGIAEDTLIFFLGDNGSDAPLGHQHQVACAEPLRGKKGAHYEGGMRVPFIAAWAAPSETSAVQQDWMIPAGRIQSHMASVMDLFPTILELAGSQPPVDHPLDGHSLHRLLVDETDEEHPETFLMHYPHAPHRSNYFSVYRDGDWKVVYHALPNEPTTGGFIQFEGGNYELFNLAEDPFESTNLANEQPAQLRRMMQAMISSLEDHRAVYPTDAQGNEFRPQLP